MRNSAASCCACGRDGLATIEPGKTLAALHRADASTFDDVPEVTFNLCISSTMLRNSEFSCIPVAASCGSAPTRPGLRSRHCSTEFMKHRFWRSLIRPRGWVVVNDCMPSTDMTRAFSRDEIDDVSAESLTVFDAPGVK